MFYVNIVDKIKKDSNISDVTNVWNWWIILNKNLKWNYFLAHFYHLLSQSNWIKFIFSLNLLIIITFIYLFLFHLLSILFILLLSMLTHPLLWNTTLTLFNIKNSSHKLNIHLMRLIESRFKFWVELSGQEERMIFYINSHNNIVFFIENNRL